MNPKAGPRLVLGAALATVAAILVLIPIAEKDREPSDWEVVSPVVAREVWDSMSELHRRILAGIVRRNIAAGRPVMAACWENSAGSQAEIDAFNSAMMYAGQTAPEFQQSGRWTSGALVSGSTAQGEPVTVTYSFVPDGANVPPAYGAPAAPSSLFSWLNGLYGSTAVWQQIFHDEFQRWGDLTGITFVHETNDDGAGLYTLGGASGVRGDIRIAAAFIDGNSGILAYASYPNSGDMVFDANDSFYNTTSNSSRRLRNVIGHELGHALGMAHVCPSDGTKLMEPYINTGFLGGQEDDVLNGQRHYGDDREPNDGSATATDLGTPPDGVFTLTDLSLDDNGDTDWFKVTIAGSKTVDLTLRPVGNTYLEGPQTSACNTGTSYDALTQQDLILDLIGTNGSTIIATANVGGAGQNEQILGQNLIASGTYFVRVRPASAFDTIQRYELDVGLAAYVSPDFSIAVTGGAPTSLVPLYPTPLRVTTANLASSPDPAQALVLVSIDGGPTTPYPMVALGQGVWFANLPAAYCGAQVDWALQMGSMAGGLPVRFPPTSAPDPFIHATADAAPILDVFGDDFSSDLGWSSLAHASVTAGAFVRVAPGPGNGGPATDADGSGFCHLTGNGLGEDLDGGPVRLISPTVDLSGVGDPVARFQIWFSNDTGPNPGEDDLEIFMSDDDGANWVLVETISAATAGWEPRSYRIADHVTPSATFKMRFRVSDPATSDSTVEAAVDDFHVSYCDLANVLAPCAAGSVGILSGLPQDIFAINGTSGGASRTVTVPVGAAYSSILSSPPGYFGAGYAMFARLGRPGPAEVIQITPTAGSMCFVPSPVDPLNPFLATVAWTYPGPIPGNPPLTSGTPTPWFAFNVGIPFPVEAAIQAVISEGPYLRVSNMVILKVQ